MFLLFQIIAARNLNFLPPMGWNSWNHYKCDINETLIKRTADLLVETGLKDLGYTYLNLDDCWAAKERVDGKLVGDPIKFPEGMKALGDYIHSKGLKFGIYSDGGALTCAGYPGSGGYEFVDAATFAEWGVDYIKHDNCYTNPFSNAKNRYIRMRNGIEKTNRTMFYSICNWGQEEPWKWGPAVGDSWRISGDIGDLWKINTWQERFNCPCFGLFCPKTVLAGGHDCSILNILDKIAKITEFTSEHGFNDPDMLEVGNKAMNEEEYRSHFSLWAALKSPLLIGTDISQMSPSTKKILMNQEIIAINQDPLRKSVKRISKFNYWQIWTGPLADNGTVLLIMNESDTARTMELPLLSPSFAPNYRKARNLWTGEEWAIRGRIMESVAAHATLVLRLSV